MVMDKFIIKGALTKALILIVPQSALFGLRRPREYYFG